MKKLITITMLLLFTVITNAQKEGDVDTGLWNEVVVTKTINKKVDFIFGGRYETKSNNTETQEFRVYTGVNIKFGKTLKWSIQPQYTFTQFATRSGRYQNEHRPTVIVTRKFVSKDKLWTYTPGLRTEFRIRQGKNDMRFVPTFSVERKVNKTTKVFTRNEFWMDTRKRDPSQYRFRTFIGFNYTVNKNLAIEPFVMYQRDTKFEPKDVFKFGVYWRIKL